MIDSVVRARPGPSVPGPQALGCSHDDMARQVQAAMAPNAPPAVEL